MSTRSALRKLPDKQTRSHQRDDAQRHLGYDQHRPRLAAAPAEGGLPGAIFQIRREIRPRGAERWNQAKQNSRKHRNGKGECQHAPIEVDLKYSGVELRRAQRPKHLTGPSGNQQADRPSRQRQHGALGEELADETPAAGAQRHAHGNFFVAARRPSQKQVRHIAAGDQQYQAGDDHQDHPRGCHGGAGAGMNRALRQRKQLGAATLVVPGIFALHLLRYAAHLRFGPLDAHVRLQPPHHREQQRPALIHPGRIRVKLRIHHHGYPDFGRAEQIQSLETVRRHTYNLEVVAIHRQSSSYNLGIAAESPHPKRVTNDCYGFCARGGIFLRKEGSPHHGPHTQRLKIIPGDDLENHRLRRISSREGAHNAGIKEKGREGRVPVPVVFVIGIRAEKVARNARVQREHGREARRIGHGQRAQENGVDEGENRGVGADPQRQRKHRHQREATALPQRAQTMAKIFDEP